MNIRKIALGAFVAGLALYAGAVMAGINYVQKEDGTACFRQDTTQADIVCFAATTGSLSVTQGSNKAGALNQFIGVPRLATFSVGASVNGAAAGHTIGHLVYVDATPAGEWVATANVASATNTAVGIPLSGNGTISEQITYGAAAVAGNGVDNTLAGGDQDWSADENFGMWIYSTENTVAGDLAVEITDSVSGAQTFPIPAVVANTWTWVVVDISGVADATKDVITTMSIDLSTAGAANHGAFDVYIATMVKWDAADEESLGQDVKTGGVYPLCVLDASGSANRPIVITEGIDFTVNYASGNDSWVAITDQSSNACGGFAAIN